jgi:nitrite reductase/ring-hydroxylating ferredoxin subunit
MLSVRDLIRIMILGRREGLRSRVRRRMRRMAGFGATDGVSYGGDGAATESVNPAEGIDIPAGFRRVAAQAELDPGQLLEVFVDGEAIALANVDGTIHAIENTCPHAGGPLGDGSLTGHSAVCPYHGWAFDVQSGVCELNDAVAVKVFEVRTHQGEICVKL